jgi:hypothetical protein
MKSFRYAQHERPPFEVNCIYPGLCSCFDPLTLALSRRERGIKSMAYMGVMADASPIGKCDIVKLTTLAKNYSAAYVERWAAECR